MSINRFLGLMFVAVSGGVAVNFIAWLAVTYPIAVIVAGAILVVAVVAVRVFLYYY